MTLRFLIFCFLVNLLSPGLVAAGEARKSAPLTPPVSQPAKKAAKSAEELYLEGNACLGAGDLGCAAVPLAALNPASPYAKLLRAQLAAAANDFETPLRLLVPLQAEMDLLPQARASLHATLARAYEAQGNTLRALEHWVACEPFLGDPAAIDAHQAHVWTMLAAQPREVLVEMRGESGDPIIQGWIDLALAVSYGERKVHNVEQWRAAYPDHPVGTALLARIVAAAPASSTASGPIFEGKIALLLPLESAVFGEAAQAVKEGFLAAHALDAVKPEVAIYATGGTRPIMEVYRQAADEGARFVVGPLTRDEVTTLSAQPLPLPTLALNQPEGEFEMQGNLFFYGLSAEAEARQVARFARNHGMQTALVVVADGTLSQRIAKAFEEAWHALDGKIAGQIVIPAPERLPEFRANAAAHPMDMIFLAADAAQARLARPYLDPAIPTFATSRVYDGMPAKGQDHPLLAVHFVDQPWLIEPGRPEFSDLPRSGSVELQRLVGLGWDAYRLVARLMGRPARSQKILEGASGLIRMGEQGVLVRELPMAQFTHQGLLVEDRP
jgi:hypothetical protein